MMRRRGRPLMRAAATTAVVAGTAGVVRHRQDQRYANQDAQQQAQQQPMYEAELPPQAPAPVAAAAPEIDMEQLKKLGDLHASGVLTDDEFASAKAKLLGS